MTDTNCIERTAPSTARLKAKFVLGYYLLTILTSAVILFVHGRLAFAADFFTTLFYLAGTALLYDLSRPRPRSLRFFAALIHPTSEEL